MGALSIIFEVIKGEMDYVRDLENIEVVRHPPQASAQIALMPMCAPIADVRRAAA